ncbi:MAG: c-type cytochrome [Pseudomonadota bacterium]
MVCLFVAAFGVATALAVPPGTDDEVRARLAPLGSLCRAGDDCGVAAVAAGPRTGKDVYDTACFACHTTGVGDAPVLGDASTWAPRVGKGMDALWGSLLNGIGAMPAKGTCMDCSDDELRAVLDYMLADVQ